MICRIVYWKKTISGKGEGNFLKWFVCRDVNCLKYSPTPFEQTCASESIQSEMFSGLRLFISCVNRVQY